MICEKEREEARREAVINQAILKSCGEESKISASTSRIEKAKVNAWAEDLPPEMIDQLETVIPESYYTKTMRDMIYYWSESPKILFELYWL